MKFRDLELYHVGRHNGLVFSGLQDGLNVIYGPNEAGKSTALSGLRAMLFGRLRGGEPTISTVRGATGILHAQSETGQRATLERSLAKKTPVKLYGPNLEATVGDDKLTIVFPEMQDIAETIYQSVFSFQLQELNDLSEQRDYLAEKLYTVGLVGQSSPIQLEQAFQNAAKAIYNPDRRARTPLLTQSLHRLQELQRQRTMAEDEVGQYLQLQRKHSELENGLQEQMRDLEEHQNVKMNLQKLLELLPRFQEIQAKQAQLREFAEVPEIPDSTVIEVSQLWESERRLSDAGEQLQAHVRELEYRLEAAVVDEELIEMLPEVQELLNRSERIQTLSQWAEEQRGELQSLRLRSGQLMTQLTGTWTTRDVTSIRWNAQLEADAKELQVSWQELDNRLRQFRHQMEQQEGVLRKNGDAFRRSFNLPTSGSGADGLNGNVDGERLERDAEELTLWRGQLDADDQRLQELDYLQSQRQQLEREQETLSPSYRTGSSRVDSNKVGQIWVVPAILTVVLAAISVWLFSLQQVAMAGIVACSALGLAGWSVWTWRVTLPALNRKISRRLEEEREYEQRRAILQTQIEKVDRQFRETRRDLKRIDCVLGQDDWSKVLWDLKRALLEQRHHLQEAQENHAQRVALARALQESMDTKRHLGRQCTHLEQKLRELEENCIQLQIDAGWRRENVTSPTAWPGELKVLRELLDNRRLLKTRLAKLEDDVHQIQIWFNDATGLLQKRASAGSTIQQRLQYMLSAMESATASEVHEDLTAANRPSVEQQLPALIEAVRRMLQLLGEVGHDAQAAQTVHAKLSHQQEECDWERNKLAEIVQDQKIVKEQLEALYERYGASTQAAFEKLLEQSTRMTRMKASQREKLLELYGLCGDEQRYRAMAEQAQQKSARQLEEQLDLLSSQISDRRQAVERTRSEIAEMKVRLKDWNSNERELLEWEVAQTKAERQSLAFEWADWKIAEELVKMARLRFEEERQPRILKIAGDMFGEITQGRYMGLKSRFDATGQASIVAVDRERQEWLPAMLSRGTREQIYLCLRLALVRDYAQRGVKLPLILDDIMVNFDAQRMISAMTLLKRVAQDSQLLYFTCHLHTAQQFSEQASAHAVQLQGNQTTRRDEVIS